MCDEQLVKLRLTATAVSTQVRLNRNATAAHELRSEGSRRRVYRPKVCGTTDIKAPSPGAHRSHLQQAARDRVLEEVDRLVLVGKVAVKEDRRRNAKDREHGSGSSGPESDQ